MKKLILLSILSIFLYSCHPKEVTVETPISVTLVENSEATYTTTVEVTIASLYAEDILYKGELPPINYVFTTRASNIRKAPIKDAPKIGLSSPRKKMQLLEVIENGDSVNGSNVWYKIENKDKVGYIHSSVSQVRRFNFDTMAKKARNLELFIENSISNNQKLVRVISYQPGAKEEEGLKKDAYGSRGEQSIVASYTNKNGKKSFRYLQDGRILSIISENKDSVIVKIPDSEYEYTVKSKNKLKELNLKNGIKKAIILDIANQVEAAFWKKDDTWLLVGYNLITSGRNDNKRAYDTPKGNFIVQNTLTFIMFEYKEKELKEDAIKREELRKKEFEKEIAENKNSETKTFKPHYTKDDYEEVTKYSRANYGIRFSGGGYLHGIPLSDDTVEKLGSEEKVIERKKQSEINLGTFKASHKCVRNVEDFQHFLYYDFIGYDKKYEDKRWRLPKDDTAVIVY